MQAFDFLPQTLTIPDLWQQEALKALRAGSDVVVHAPTGAGKTHIFELFFPKLRGQAIFTVPTRALANDKLAEWRRRGWDVGIATGDVALRLDAKVVVATLETQKGRMLEGKGPALLVIDEYQMIADPVRGVNYELAVALARPETQLLLLSGSVANPQDVVAWLRRLGRKAELISHAERPVPLEEVDLDTLPNRAPAQIRLPWARRVFNALRADLGPVLLFAPRRKAAEELAEQLAAALPMDRPLHLSGEQMQLAGTRLRRMLEAGVAFHHSGLSYAQRAELIEPLAKAGQLRAVVATMGLAAGINFSMRSVAITGTSYMAGPIERQVQPDELLQMYGRAGRRGLDETGYALITMRPPRLLDARPRQLRRSEQIDWPSLIAVMRGAAAAGRDPFAAAREVNERLFTLQKAPLGVEHSVETGPMPCDLRVDAERARFARRGTPEIFNSRGEWEPKSAAGDERPMGEALIFVQKTPGAQEEGTEGSWRPCLSSAASLKGVGTGNLCKLSSGPEGDVYGRELVVGTRRGDGALTLAPVMRRLLGKSAVTAKELQSDVLARFPEWSGGGMLAAVLPRGDQLFARASYAARPTAVWIDSAGRALVNPPERRELPAPCRQGFAAPGAERPTGGERPGACPEIDWCLRSPISGSAAYAWRQLGLIDAGGRPTRRGIIFSYFQQGEGLAIAAALEDEQYEIEELVFDLANLRAGPRFAGDDAPHTGRLAVICQRTYQRADLPGYLEMGAPPAYGAGASEAVRAILDGKITRSKLLTDFLRMGDLERAVLEWRSLLRHVTHAPDEEWPRWRQLKAAAARQLNRE